MATRKKTVAPLPTELVDEALAVIETPEQVIPPKVDDNDLAISDDLIFTTPEGPAPEITDDDMLEFQVDGQNLIAIRPNPDQWGVLMTMLARSATIADRVAAMQNFASTVLDEGSFLYLQNRLLDREDLFGTEMFDRVISAIINKFTPEGNRAERRAAARARR
uniref:hypothetical protein n=1 Tax=Micromonospora sp. NBC_00855 TaxID=2975978 RepID=UPI0022544D3D|nr:hypothetical protein OHB51_35585 [Micromonospora sp. NBC_00855]